MLVIFSFSSQSYDQQDLRPWLKDRVPEQVIKEHFSSVKVNYHGSEVSIRKKGVPGFVEFFIRKGAHVFEYALLGLLSARLLWRLLRGRIGLTLLCSLLFCAIYSTSDEVHQIFTPNRTPMATDVLLDSSGAAFGILLLMAYYWFMKRRSHSL
ncbi:VanZ family protein [Paenibacillus cremeus]|uniref:VanZ family protein n=2 Tax=Paenibacillus cremeus TaxID=2163881 RepID=A0A559KED2_9BACL|nr:VanZ family protein [Paenibacillus cremeus]